MIYVDGEKCAGCGVCEDVCPVEAIWVSDGVARIDQHRCNECQACVEACPNQAILVVIEPAEEKAISLREQPAPEVALAEPHRPPAPLGSQVAPVLGAALAFLGREVAPRLAMVLMDALDRRLSQQPNTVGSTQGGGQETLPNTEKRGGKGGPKGRRRRQRRRGK
jgi:NAD-dependent dihydropyrimidine dehydrogenase PreA subunit